MHVVAVGYIRGRKGDGSGVGQRRKEGREKKGDNEHGTELDKEEEHMQGERIKKERGGGG